MLSFNQKKKLSERKEFGVWLLKKKKKKNKNKTKQEGIQQNMCESPFFFFFFF